MENEQFSDSAYIELNICKLSCFCPEVHVNCPYPLLYVARTGKEVGLWHLKIKEHKSNLLIERNCRMLRTILTVSSLFNVL